MNWFLVFIEAMYYLSFFNSRIKLLKLNLVKILQTYSLNINLKIN